MAHVSESKKACAVNPLKMSQPLGASYAFMGLQSCMPVMHGSQGCTSFGLVLLVRHFKEAIPLQTTAMNEVTTIMGGYENIEKALLNIRQRAKPQIIAICSTGLTETKGDDVHADVRMDTYEAHITQRALGQGDSDAKLWGPRGDSVPDRVILLGLDIKMFYGGPKEAVMHGIYRQNFGFTDIIIGRKHADAPYQDGTAIWGDFDAQEIFDKLGGQLLIKPLKVGFAAFYDSIGRVDLTENHPDEKPVSISGKDVRKALVEGRDVDPRIMRESTSRILAQAMKGLA